MSNYSSHFYADDSDGSGDDKSSCPEPSLPFGSTSAQRKADVRQAQQRVEELGQNAAAEVWFRRQQSKGGK